MNCYKHPEVQAVAFCRTCGKPLCQTCQRPVEGTIVCEEHAPPQVTPPPAPAPQPIAASASPGLAFVLGLIPGVGAIYNGQYVKGIIHVVIFGLLISITSSGAASDWEPLFGLLIAIWYFYMPFEAYHTARRRQFGQPVDEFSSLVRLRPRHMTGQPIGPIVLMALGVIFLLNTLGILHLQQCVRYWPVLLIAIGAYQLYCRLAGDYDQPASREKGTPNEPH